MTTLMMQKQTYCSSGEGKPTYACPVRNGQYTIYCSCSDCAIPYGSVGRGLLCDIIMSTRGFKPVRKELLDFHMTPFLSGVNMESSVMRVEESVLEVIW